MALHHVVGLIWLERSCRAGGSPEKQYKVKSLDGSCLDLINVLQILGVYINTTNKDLSERRRKFLETDGPTEATKTRHPMTN